MTRDDVLKIINNIVEGESPLTESVYISDCDDLDSSALLSIFVKFKSMGYDCDITDFIAAKTVGDLISIFIK